MNGPVRDGDGFIDGTCNFCILVRLAQPPSAYAAQEYALLWLDEQSAFTHRWREVHPDDHDGLMLALVKALDDDPEVGDGAPPFEVADFWCPFRAGHIWAHSRLAAAATVLVVNGVDTSSGTEELYSINFSYATCDRSWARRSLPRVNAVRLADFDPAAGDSVVPESVRIRDDATIHLLGARGGQRGRSIQSYVPKGAFSVPGDGSVFVGAWDFVAEETFQRMSRFSHFGVYQRVSSRSQYYRADVPESGGATLAAVAPATMWSEAANLLWIDFRGIDLNDPMALARQLAESAAEKSPVRKRPPTLFNETTDVRFSNRGRFGWIVTWYDKRDDDLQAFSGPDGPVSFISNNRQVSATLGNRHEVWFPPSVVRGQVHVRRRSSAPSTLTITLEHAPPADRSPGNQAGVTASVEAFGPDPEDQFFGNVWRVHLQGLPPGPVWGTNVVTDLGSWLTDGLFARVGGIWEATIEIPEDQAGILAEYCSEGGRRNLGTTLWFEDIVGHVATPDAVAFRATSEP